jgi:hypothetical protein
MTMHQKMQVLVFFNTCPKRVILKKNKIKFDHYLVFSGLHLSSLLVKYVKDVACESSHNNFYMFNVNYM